VTRLNNFTAGAVVGDGTGVSTTNSDDSGEDAFTVATASTGGTIVYRQDPDFPGGWCAEATQATANNQPVCTELREASGATSFATRVYLKLTGLPSAAVAFPFQPRNTADSQQGSVQLGADGFLRLANSGGTTVATGAVAVPLNTLVRVEFYGTGFGGTGTWTAQWFTAHAIDPADTVTSASVTTSGTLDRVRAGRMGNQSAVATWRQGGFVLVAGSSSPIGPAYLPGRPRVVRREALNRSSNW
jgi:hypothetical protein